MSSPIAESKPEGDNIDENLPSLPDGVIPVSSNQENGRSARLESLIAEQTAIISTLVEGIQDTNRLLRLLVSQKAAEVPVPEALVGAAPENEPGPQIPIQDNEQITNHPNSDEKEGEEEEGENGRRWRGTRLQGKFEDLRIEYLNSPPPPEVLKDYHRFFLEGIGRSNEPGHARDAVISSDVYKAGSDRASLGRMEVPWAVMVNTRLSLWILDSRSGLDPKYSALRHYLSGFWDSGPVEANDLGVSGVDWLWEIQWPRNYSFLEAPCIPLSAFLVYCVPGSDQIQAPQSLERKWNGVGALTSPGAFW